jgi:3-deoxy-D-manno-octulosonic-acid transferase
VTAAEFARRGLVLAFWKIAYRIAFAVFAPPAILRLAMRRRGKKRVRPLGEYLGFYRGDKKNAAAPIWIHAVSVGEVNAAAPLIERLLASGDTPLLLTQTTAAGFARARDCFGDSPAVDFAAYPLDCGFAVRRFLRRFRPRLGVVMETEIWPQMQAACREAGVLLLLANARLSKKSARGYAKIAPLTADALSCFSAIAAQSKHDARRLRFFGASRVALTGNLKFDRRIANAERQSGDKIRAAIRAGPYGAKKILLFASTRAGEEEQIAAAAADDKSRGDFFIINVPRHPERGGEAAAAWQKRGFKTARRARGNAVGDADVLIGDTLGEMAAYCAAADAVFIGGSLMPAYGGQSPLEAMALKKPVVVGPHTANFAAIIKDALAAGAITRAPNAAAAVAKLKNLTADDNAANTMGEAAAALCAQSRGAAEKTIGIINELSTPPRQQTDETAGRG